MKITGSQTLLDVVYLYPCFVNCLAFSSNLVRVQIFAPEHTVTVIPRLRCSVGGKRGSNALVKGTSQ